MANKGTTNKTYEIKVQSGHVKKAEPQQPGKTINNTTLNMQKEQVGTANPNPHQGKDIDMQLEVVTHEHGGSLLRLCTSQECLEENQL